MKHRNLALAASLLAVSTVTVATGDTALPSLRLRYESAFRGLPPPTDPPLIDWSRSNARVGALQGHAGHLRPDHGSPPAQGPRTAPAGAPGSGQP